jgi:hypothetical protein
MNSAHRQMCVIMGEKPTFKYICKRQKNFSRLYGQVVMGTDAKYGQKLYL